MWEETAVGAVALGGVAIAAAGGSQRRRSRSRHGPLHRPGVRGAFVALAVAAAAVQVPGLIATQRIRASQAAFRDGDLTAAARLASDAQSAEPWAADPRVQLGLIQEREGRTIQAQQTVRSALSREPTNWQIPLVLSRIELERGSRAAARRIFEHGRRLAPHSPFYTTFSSIEREAISPVKSNGPPVGRQP
jgi:Flp pilus assembly protein TadD